MNPTFDESDDGLVLAGGGSGSGVLPMVAGNNNLETGYQQILS